MQNRDFSIKTMNKKELAIAIDWAAQEGWNPGLHDIESYFEADNNGFLIAYLGDEPIATISVLKYADSFGFLGFYIVKPAYRAKGYGIQIWNAGLKYLKDINIGLDGVLTQQENYKKSGFKLAYRNIRYEGIGGGSYPQNADIVELSSLAFDPIDRYDQAFFPARRSEFSKLWISQPQSYALGIMKNGELAAYGVMRKCRNGYKIAPLFADDKELAQRLFLALKSKTNASEAIFLDTPEVNQDAVALAEENEMKISFETARMYKGAFPDMPLNRIFGITSFEIG